MGKTQIIAKNEITKIVYSDGTTHIFSNLKENPDKNSCSTIICNDSTKLLIKIKEIKENEIKYYNCNGDDKTEYVLKKKEINYIIYYDGSKHIFKPDDSSVNVYNNTKANNNKKGSRWAITSFTVSILGFFIAGIICGTLAIIVGAIGLNKRLKGLAIAGIIIEIIDIIGVIIVLSSL